MIYGYIRTSTKRQKPDSQKMSIERWAKEHELPIDEYIEDLAVSGASRLYSRNGFCSLMKKVKAGDIIVCFDFSRVTRANNDVDNMWLMALAGLGIRLVAINDYYDTMIDWEIFQILNKQSDGVVQMQKFQSKLMRNLRENMRYLSSPIGNLEDKVAEILAS